MKRNNNRRRRQRRPLSRRQTAVAKVTAIGLSGASGGTVQTTAGAVTLGPREMLTFLVGVSQAVDSASKPLRRGQLKTIEILGEQPKLFNFDVLEMATLFHAAGNYPGVGANLRALQEACGVEL